MHAQWLPEDDRWRYIQSICSVPRSDGAQRKKSPASVTSDVNTIERSGSLAM